MIVSFRPGQRVRLIGIPSALPPDSEGLPTTALFEACLGQTFVIADVDECVVALDVGKVLGMPPWKHTIYVEPHLLEAVTNERR